ncbi:MAG: hypothetical protein J2P20_13320, partial [Pseudonocardia sp.]|nr:hypothetical protein [Pseudonocardia sp.]
ARSHRVATQSARTLIKTGLSRASASAAIRRACCRLRSVFEFGGALVLARPPAVVFGVRP